MALPVIELIAQNVLATVGGITEAGGFNFNLTVQRHTRNGDKRIHLNAVIVQEDPKKPHDKVYNALEWDVTFGIGVFVIPVEGDETAIDTYANLICADVQRAVMVDRYRGGNALDTTVLEPETAVDPESGADLVIVKVETKYRTSELDPRINAR